MKRLLVIALSLSIIASVLGGLDVWGCAVAPKQIARLNTTTPPPVLEPTFDTNLNTSAEEVSTAWAQITEKQVGGRYAACLTDAVSVQRILFIVGLVSVGISVLWLLGRGLFWIIRKLGRRHER